MADQVSAPNTKPKPRLTKAEIAARIREAGERARAEAEARRANEPQAIGAKPKEIGGPKGPEPTRYGDWERNGIVSDF